MVACATAGINVQRIGIEPWRDTACKVLVVSTGSRTARKTTVWTFAYMQDSTTVTHKVLTVRCTTLSHVLRGVTFRFGT